MKLYLKTIILALSILLACKPLATQEPASSNTTSNERYRVIVTSDFPMFAVTNSDPDDVQSIVRFLLYSNEFDVEGLIVSAGTFDMVAEKKNMLAYFMNATRATKM